MKAGVSQHLMKMLAKSVCTNEEALIQKEKTTTTSTKLKVSHALFGLFIMVATQDKCIKI